MKAKINKAKNEIVITLPLNKAGTKSSTGKTYLLASSGGSQPILIEGYQGVKASLNIFSKEDVLA